MSAMRSQMGDAQMSDEQKEARDERFKRMTAVLIALVTLFAAIVAYLNPRSMAALIKCEDGWCRVRADKVTGWAPAAELWGTSDAVQCKVAVRTPARGR